MPDISLPVSAQFPHPPLQFLSASPITTDGVVTPAGGAFLEGRYVFTRPLPPLLPVSAFGFMWSVALENPFGGHIAGEVAIYEERVVQVVTHHRLLDGTLVNSAIVNAHTDGYTLFDTFPEDVTVLVAIGYGVQFFWLVVI